MKKIVFLLAALISALSVACFAGCNDKRGNGSYTPDNGTVLTESDDGENGAKNGDGKECPDGKCPDDGCPDGGCEKRGMPEFRFEHGRGNPVKDGNDGGHKRPAPRPPRKPRPAPPSDGEENPTENENGDNN